MQLAGLIPAAGASRRMGRDKRRLTLDGRDRRTVLEITVGSLIDGGLDPVIVVLEPSSPCRELSGLRAARLVVNPRPDRGMLSSIVAGLDALRQAHRDPREVAPEEEAPDQRSLTGFERGIRFTELPAASPPVVTVHARRHDEEKPRVPEEQSDEPTHSGRRYSR